MMNIDPFLFLEEEARQVARAMAETRAQCLAELVSHPAGKGPERDSWDAPRQGPQGPLGFSPFYYFPFLFAGAFPSLCRDTLRTLCVANRVLLEAVLLQDRQIDESRPWTPEDLYLVDSYHRRAMEMMLPLFPPDHLFWTRSERFFTRYARAVLREQFRHRYRLSPYGRQAFLAIAAGKVALIRTTLHALAELSGRRRFLSALLGSQTLFLVGFQAFDDLKDWKQDLRNGNFTHLLTRVLLEGGFRDRVAAGDLPTVLEVGTVLYFHGIASEQLLLAERLFQRALSLCGEAPVPLWKEVIAGFSRSCSDMRNDFAEIHRRARFPERPLTTGNPQSPGAGTPSVEAGHSPDPVAQPALKQDTQHGPGQDIPARILQGLAFIQNNQPPPGGFPLLSSPCAYLNPSTGLPPSRGVTRLVLRSLSPLEGLHPSLTHLLEKAQHWLTASAGPPDPASGLPGYFEAAFRPGLEAPERDLPPDGSVPPPSPDRFNGLYWTDQAHLARCGNTRLARLESMTLRCVRSSDYAPWYRTNPTGHCPPAGIQAACRPFLPLLLLLQAPGCDLFRPLLLERLREYLLGRLRVAGGWTNATDTALHLLCMLASGHTGNERRSAVEKLVRLQEPDGSWAPNAFYKQDGVYFGSRELTTAWCVCSLFLDTIGTGRFHPSTARREGPPREPCVLFLRHRGVPATLKKGAETLLQRHASLLPGPDRARVTLGTWDSMPAHFLLPHGDVLLVGINLLRPLRPPFRSSAMRPYLVEVVLGLFLAARVSRRGPLNDRLERIYVLGLAVSACRRIWPGQPFHLLGGMSSLEERWCREHEPYLWSRVRAFLTHPAPHTNGFRWLLPCSAPGKHGAIPTGSALYLGYTLFGDGPATRAPTAGEAFVHLLDAGREEILQTFRSRAGLDPTLHNLLGRSLRETHSA